MGFQIFLKIHSFLFIFKSCVENKFPGFEMRCILTSTFIVILESLFEVFGITDIGFIGELNASEDVGVVHNK